MCLNPMLAVRTDKVNYKTGKKQYKFIGSLKNLDSPEFDLQLRESGRIEILEDYIDRRYDDEIDRRIRNRAWPYDVDRETGEVRNRAVILPCGQCIECRCKYAQQWASRIMLESRYHEKSYFLTLTYDEEHVPISEAEDGTPSLTLCPKELQDFVKRLRRDQEYHHGNTIRFYAVGEYGSLFHRPHYHLIVFGLILDDVKVIGRNKHGTVIHDSDTIRKIWGKGRTEVDELTFESAAYCARYTTKKLGKTESGIYESLGLVPEFTRMSLKPAIGYQYFEEHMQEIYDFDKIYLSTGNGGRTVKPPRYYDQKFDDIYPETMASVKQNRREVAEKQLKLKFAGLSGSYVEFLANQAEAYIKRTRSLKRDLE